MRAVAAREKPVLAGVVENVVQCHKWDQWGRWLREIQATDYTPDPAAPGPPVRDLLAYQPGLEPD